MTHTCAICHTPVQREIDPETGHWTYSSWCSGRCFTIAASSPYCHNHGCSARIGGSRMLVTNGREAASGATANYRCGLCGLAGTLIHLATLRGYATGRTDAVRHEYLVPARTKSATGHAASSYAPNRAYGRAYLLGLRHADAAKVVIQ